MKISIIGVGLIGVERIKAVKKISESTKGDITIKSIYDPDLNRSREAAEQFGVYQANSLESAMEGSDVVFVCTPHHITKSVITKAYKHTQKIMVEKPLGRNIAELREIVNHKPASVKLAVGFNYRFFRGVERIISDANSGRFGQILSVNMILGHGNSPGMEKSWKLDLEKCGGGCLIDPGIHLLDIALQLSEQDLEPLSSTYWSGFWKTGIEEEVHLIMKNQSGTIFNMQTSLIRWRSEFNIQINGTEGYGVVTGRGRSYGSQAYKVGRRWGWLSGVSQVESEIIEIAGDPAEDSFLKETLVFLGLSIPELLLVEAPISSVCSLEEAVRSMELLEKCRTQLLNIK